MIRNVSIVALSRHRIGLCVTGIAYYYGTSIVVLLGVCLGTMFMNAGRDLRRHEDVVGRFANWDGEWFVRIVETGYSYEPDTQCTVAFSPAYPLLAGWVAQITALP